MIYKCRFCNYNTIRPDHLLRHEYKKKKCSNILKDNLVKQQDPVKHADDPVKHTDDPVKHADDPVKHAEDPVKHAEDPAKHAEDPAKHAEDPAKHTEDPAKHTEDKIRGYSCLKCNKMFTRKDHMMVHSRKCDGQLKNQCEICLKIFCSVDGRVKHNKYVKCKKVAVTSVNNDHVLNITNTNTNTTNNNTITNITNTTNNIQLNFGKECLTGLCNEPNYRSKIIENINCGKYALIRSLDAIYFNEKYPNNHTLKKERRNDKMVEILVNGTWEKRLIEDVFQPISDTIQEYHRGFFQSILTDNEMLKKNKFALREFGQQMLWYGWKMAFFESIGDSFELLDDEDDDIRKKKLRDMKNLLMEKIYDRSKIDDDIKSIIDMDI